MAHGVLHVAQRHAGVERAGAVLGGLDPAGLGEAAHEPSGGGAIEAPAELVMNSRPDARSPT